MPHGIAVTVTGTSIPCVFGIAVRNRGAPARNAPSYHGGTAGPNRSEPAGGRDHRTLSDGDRNVSAQPEPLTATA